MRWWSMAGRMAVILGVALASSALGCAEGGAQGGNLDGAGADGVGGAQDDSAQDDSAHDDSASGDAPEEGGDSGGGGTPDAATDDADATQGGGDGVELPSGPCDGDLVVEEGGAFGALAVSDDGVAYVVGNTNYGASWRLAEVELASPALTPLSIVEDGDFSVMQADWIRLAGDAVHVYEFYPTGYIYAYDRATQEMTAGPAGSDPTQPEPYEEDGATFAVYVGQGEGDACDNVCIHRQELGVEEPLELLDDGNQPFSIHTGSIHFVPGYCYFMTYQSVFNPPGGNALRRVPLAGGEPELVHEFPAGHLNAWIHALLRAPDGTLYWLRYEQESEKSPWLGFIDHHDPVTNESALGIVDGVQTSATSLTLHGDDTLLWTDDAGLRSAPTSGGAPVTLVELGTESDAHSLYFAVHGSRVYYSRSESSADEKAASIGCVELPAP